MTTPPPAPPVADQLGQTLWQPRASKMIKTNLLIGVVVALVWLIVGNSLALTSLVSNWRVTVTMVFGSLVGGGTSEGGGAIGFPMLTKILHVPAPQARLFTYAIQSVGMTGASISILINKVPFEASAIRWGGPSAVVAVIVSAVFLAPLMPSRTVRLIFTVLLVALALALAVHQLIGSPRRNATIPRRGGLERSIVVIGGLVGGTLSGIAGLGENTIMFIALVLLFRVSEKVATPTTVLLLTMVSVAAFLTHVLIIGDFTQPVLGYWLAAIPVVAFCAPLGAFLCTRMSLMTIRVVLWTLIGVELVSTVAIIPLTPTEYLSYGLALLVATAACVLLTRVRRYAPERLSPERHPVRTVAAAGKDLFR